MLPKPFSPASLRFLSKLKGSGYEAYLVGGCVRDALRGVEPTDYDICTSAKPEEVSAVFSDCLTIPTGLKHGTVTVIFEETPFETTTFRSELGYSDGRHPDKVRFTKELKEDLSRRDFTMNAIAWDPEQGFIDPFHGIDAIRKRQIICVGVPEKRFKEDALRMLRAVRFYSTLGFSITEATVDGILRCAGSISRVSGERIREEVKKILLSDRASDGTRLLLSYFGKPLFGEEAPLLEPSLPLEQFAADNKLPAAAAALLLRANDPEMVLRKLRCSNDFTGAVLQILKLMRNDFPATPSGARRLCHATAFSSDAAALYDALHPGRPPLLPLVREATCSGSHYPLQISDLAINGDDLIRAGVPKGREIGRILERLMDMVLEDPEKNTAPILLEEAKKMSGDS